MKSLFILTAGILIGWLGSQLLGVTNSQHQHLAEDSVTQRNSARSPAEAEARSLGLRGRSDEVPREQAAFDARLKAALAAPSAEVSSSQQKPSNDRFSSWLAGVTLSEQLKDAIRAQLEVRQVAGDEEPLTAGSPFDLWLRDRLDASALASWTANQNAQSADRIERRANRLLVGLQSSLALTPEQKDAIYPQLVEWAGENPQNILGNDSQDAAEQEKSLAARVEKLSALVPAEQREALADWVAEFLPTYCLQESD
jgi:hypothetical protein